MTHDDLDRQQVVADIQRRHPGWLVWWGRATGGYDAYHRDVPALVLAPTPDLMDAAMERWGSWVAAAELAEPGRGGRVGRPRPAASLMRRG